MKTTVGELYNTLKRREEIIDKYYEFMNESTSASIYHLLFGTRPNIDQFVIMTSVNPNEKYNTKEYMEKYKILPWIYDEDVTNKQRLENIKKAVSLLGFGYRRVDGIYQGMEEDSLLIPRMSRSRGIEIGRSFGQQAIIHATKEMKDGKAIVHFELIYCFEDGENITRNMVFDGRIVSPREDTEMDKPLFSDRTEYKGRQFYIPFFDNINDQKQLQDLRNRLIRKGDKISDAEKEEIYKKLSKIEECVYTSPSYVEEFLQYTNDDKILTESRRMEHAYSTLEAYDNSKSSQKGGFAYYSSKKIVNNYSIGEIHIQLEKIIVD